MPAAADRLFAPEPAAPSRRPILAALAVCASVAVHGVALAAAIGLWGAEEAAPPQAFEVVMVTLTRPNPAPAPGTAPGSAAPDPAERGGPPAVAMPVADAATPAVRAPRPVSARAAAPAPPVGSPPPPEPVRVRSAATAPPSAVAETIALEQARVAQADTAQPPKAQPETIQPAAAQPVASTPAVAEPPRPVARPQPAAGSRTEPARQVATLPAGQPEALPAPSSAVQNASRGAASEPAGAGSSPAEFALGSAGNPVPDYPFRARQRGWEGRVVLRVAVDRKGRPIRIDVAESSGHGVLDQAAHRTITTWVFQPATRGGQAVAGETLVPIVFRLN